MISHPDIDPVAITAALKVAPSSTAKFGTQRTAPDGSQLPGTYRNSRWTASFENLEHKSIGELTEHAIDQFPEKSAFWSMLKKAGGSAEIILSIVGTHAQGSTISETALQKLARMGMRMGVEVYVDPQN